MWCEQLLAWIPIVSELFEHALFGSLVDFFVVFFVLKQAIRMCHILLAPRACEKGEVLPS
jgi:hypothetical protein